MNQVEYAAIMTKDELTGYFDNLITRSNRRKNEAVIVLEKNAERVFLAYEEYEQKQVAEYYEQKKEWLRLRKCWDEKVCSGCGAPIRIIEGAFGNFWSCPNYKSPGVHPTLPMEYEDRHNERSVYIHVRIETHWCTALMKSLQLPSYVKASDMLLFLTENGYEDLRKKYDYKSTAESISGYVTAKKQSSAEEKIIAEYITKLFPKAVHQLGIRYKLTAEQEKVAIVDSIAADEQTVYLLEIKRTMLDIVPQQLALYEKLLQHILVSQKDMRPCRALFVIYNRNMADGYLTRTTNFIYFDEIAQVMDRQQVKRFFDHKTTQ